MENLECCSDLSCPTCSAPMQQRLTLRAIELLQLRDVGADVDASQPAPLGRLVRAQLVAFASSGSVCFAMTLQRCRGFDRVPFVERCTSLADHAARLAVDAHTINATRAPDDWHKRILARSLLLQSMRIEQRCEVSR